MLTNDFLFKPKKGKGYKKNDDHLALMIETLGKFSKDFILSGKKHKTFFDKNGDPAKIDGLKEYKLSYLLNRHYNFNQSDA